MSDELDISETPPVSSSVWRLGPGGNMLTSVDERNAADLASMEFPLSIYFYADLEGSSQLFHDEGTMDKVYRALASVGLSEGQVINAVNQMQNAGILFRETSY